MSRAHARLRQAAEHGDPRAAREVERRLEILLRRFGDLRHLTEADRSEATHRAAVSYLEATGKPNYSADEYVAAVELVESTKEGAS